MGFYQLKRVQSIRTDLDTLWTFISNPANLKAITPDYMGFEITSEDLPGYMYEGMIIKYQVSPLLRINTTWVTEITHIVEKKYFIDEQRIGPYKMWHHQHLLDPSGDGIKMTDIVSYKPPFGPLGTLANFIVIRNKLDEIFDYRTRALDAIFNSPNE
jgi:ligand-binding SRPBCC domain-containing protein